MRLEGALLTLDLDGLGTGISVPFQLQLQLSERHAQHGLEVADEAVHVALPRHLVDDVLVVVVTQTSTELLVVHLGLVLSGAPPASDLFGVNQLELPLATRPCNAVLAVAIREQLQEELPQLDWSRSRWVGSTDLRRGAWTGGGDWAVHGRMEWRSAWRRHWRSSR